MSIPNTIESILKRKTVDSNGCWNWTGSLKDNGYAQVSFRGHKEYVHRLVYKQFQGKIPKKKPQILHRCDNRACFNYKHLFPGTQADNVADMISKGREASPKQKARVGVLNGRAVLTPSLVKAIRREYKRYSRTYGSRPLGIKYGVHDSHIRLIIKGGTWKEESM